MLRAADASNTKLVVGKGSKGGKEQGSKGKEGSNKGKGKGKQGGKHDDSVDRDTGMAPEEYIESCSTWVTKQMGNLRWWDRQNVCRQLGRLYRRERAAVSEGDESVGGESSSMVSRTDAEQ